MARRKLAEADDLEDIQSNHIYKLTVKLDVKRSNQHCYRCGAEEARGAHNSEDT